MSVAKVPAVERYATKIKILLARARELKPNGGVEPPVNNQVFGNGLSESGQSPGSPSQNYAAIETACREIFYSFIASTSIDDTAFGEVWNLFDILSALSDLGSLTIL